MTPLKSHTRDKMTYDPEISPSVIYSELEHFHIDVLYDPLASTTGTTSYFKLQNLRVISNDQALFVYSKGKAFWENNHFTIPDELSKILTDKSGGRTKPEHYKTLGRERFTDEERSWLEYWRRKITGARDEYVTALAETAVCLVMDHWITAKRFGSTSDWSPPDLLGYYINHVNGNLLDNEESNEMWREDPKELSEKVIADIMFFHPPPLKGYAAFGEREKLLESWLRGVSDFPLERIALSGVLGSKFEDKNKYMVSLAEMLRAADHIPIWAIVISNRQPFTRLELEELLKSIDRHPRAIDLNITLQFFSRRAPDTILVATK
ncbi:MAG: hypothetical protein ABIC40_05325 [bacterium]